jgi:hypothetical protein
MFRCEHDSAWSERRCGNAGARLEVEISAIPRESERTGTQGLTLRVLYQGTPSGVPDGSLAERASAPEFAAKASNRPGAAAKADWLPTRLFGTAEAVP